MTKRFTRLIQIEIYTQRIMLHARNGVLTINEYPEMEGELFQIRSNYGP
jgi:hypothetical protein